MMITLYWFRQNNSGGVFHLTNEVTHEVFVEASSAEEADVIAEQHGIYFNGCHDGKDCPCCGDRWSRAVVWDSVEVPDRNVTSVIAALDNEFFKYESIPAESFNLPGDYARYAIVYFKDSVLHLKCFTDFS